MSEVPRTRRRIRSAVLPVLVSAAIVVPNLIVVALGTEDYPFTTAPMFAHYVGHDTDLYSFRFEGVRDGVAEPVPIDQTNADERLLWRQFTAWYYRPMSDTAPLRDVSGRSNDPERFAERMADFFGPMTDFLREQRGIDYERVDLYVDRVDYSGTVLDTELVGDYDTATGTYTQSYEVGR